MKNFKNIFAINILTISMLLLACAPTEVPGNNNPVILSMTPSKKIVDFGESVTIIADVKDVDGDSLSYLWSPGLGSFKSTSLDSAIWVSPDTAGAFGVSLRVFDIFGAEVIDSTVITVNNRLPSIVSLTADENSVLVGSSIVLRVVASDPDNGELTYLWDADEGSFETSVDADTVVWKAPENVAEHDITVTVTDQNGGKIEQSITLIVFQETGSVWVADTFNDRVVKLSTNGDVISFIPGFNKPVALAVNEDDRSLWVADKFNNKVLKFNDDGELVTEIPDLQLPKDILVRPNNSNVWVLTENDTAQAYELSYEGEILRSVGGLKEPSRIDVYNLKGEIWIADKGNDRVILLDPSFTGHYDIDSVNVNLGEEILHRVFDGMFKPEELAVNQTTGNVWITDTGNNRVLRIERENFGFFEITGFNGPTGIDVDDKTNAIWVANKGEDQVVKILPEILELRNFDPPQYDLQTKAGNHYIVEGDYIYPNTISVNSNDQIVWFTADHNVVKVLDRGDNDIQIVKNITNFDGPRGIFVVLGNGN